MDLCGIAPFSVGFEKICHVHRLNKGDCGKSTGEFGVTEEINYSYARTHAQIPTALNLHLVLNVLCSCVVWMDLYVQKCWRSKTERFESLYQKTWGVCQD